MQLPRPLMLGALACLVAAVYVQVWGWPDVRKLRQTDGEVLLQLMQQGSTTDSWLILFIGRFFFGVGVFAYAVLCGQSIFAAIQRSLYKPIGHPPLAPATPADQATSASDAAQPPATAAATAAAGPPSAQQQQQQAAGPSGSRDPRDAARQRALEAAQRALDEQTAALKAAKEQAEADKKARQQAAAAVAAQQAAEQAAQLAAQHAAQQAAREAAASQAAERAAAAAASTSNTDLESRRQAWNEAVQQQWRGVQPRPASTSQNSSDAGSDSAAVDAETARLAAQRKLKEQQDQEYEASLARDRARSVQLAEQRAAAAARASEREQQKRLAALRLRLQETLPPEPAAAAAGSNGVLSLRVRLPDGSHASRRFSAVQCYDDVLSWVYSLPAMPLWAPGNWALASSYPRRQLAPPAGSEWTCEGWQQRFVKDLEAEAAELQPGQWLLEVRQLGAQPVWVKARDQDTISEVKQLVQVQAGIPARDQRLIYGGRLLTDDRLTLTHLGITQGHALQLAPRGASSTGRGSHGGSSDGGAAADAAVAAAGSNDAGDEAANGSGSDDGGGGGAGDSVEVVVVSTVGELQDKVAHGAAQLALFVAATDSPN